MREREPSLLLTADWRLAIHVSADWRLPIWGLPIGDCRLDWRLTIGDWLPIRANRQFAPIANPQIGNRHSPIPKSAIAIRQFPNRQSPFANPQIGNRQSPIRQSAIYSRQSAMSFLELHHRGPAAALVVGGGGEVLHERVRLQEPGNPAPQLPGAAPVNASDRSQLG